MSVNARRLPTEENAHMGTAEPHSDWRAATSAAFRIVHQPPLLLARFAEPHDLLSWSITRPGLQIATEVVWLELRNSNLPLDTDADAVIREKLAAAGYTDAVAFVTSRDIARHHYHEAHVEAVSAGCLTTVGLSNGERVGQRTRVKPARVGTINTLLHVSRPLTQGALVEALAIVASARTAAVLDSGVRRDGVAITGTGTDCIAVAAPHRDAPERFAGLHTALGEAIGAAVYAATRDGIATWQIDYAAFLQAQAEQGPTQTTAAGT